MERAAAGGDDSRRRKQNSRATTVSVRVGRCRPSVRGRAGRVTEEEPLRMTGSAKRRDGRHSRRGKRRGWNLAGGHFSLDHDLLKQFPHRPHTYPHVAMWVIPSGSGVLVAGQPRHHDMGLVHIEIWLHCSQNQHCYPWSLHLFAANCCRVTLFRQLLTRRLLLGKKRTRRLRSRSWGVKPRSSQKQSTFTVPIANRCHFPPPLIPRTDVQRWLC